MYILGLGVNYNPSDVQRVDTDNLDGSDGSDGHTFTLQELFGDYGLPPSR